MSHQDRREPLPKGYQFGDASRTEWNPQADTRTWQEAYRAGAKLLVTCGVPVGSPLAVGSCQTGKTLTTSCWNVIEGEPFASDAERHPVVTGFITNRDLGDEA